MVILNTEEERKTFLDSGYVHIKNMLSVSEVDHYRIALYKHFGVDATAKTTDTLTEPDGVTRNAPFWPLITHKSLNTNLTGLLGSDFAYTQHSDLHINLRGGRFHRDSVDRVFGVGEDWNSEEPYSVFRVAIYLTGYRESDTSLIVIPGSHKWQSSLNKLELRFHNGIKQRLRKFGFGDSYPHFCLSAKYKKLKMNPGDCVIFDQRLVHAGGNVSKRKEVPKLSIFLSYGLRNSHSYRHREYYLARPGYVESIDNELLSMLNEEKLRL